MTTAKRLSDDELDLIMQKRKEKASKEKQEMEEETKRRIKKIRESIPKELRCLELDEKASLSSNRAVFLHTYDNLLLFIERHASFKGHFWHCEFEDLNLTDIFRNKTVSALEEDVYAVVKYELMKVFDNKKFSKDDVQSAIRHVCLKNACNPVVQKLSSLEWDGVERLESFFIDTIGAEDTPYTKTLTKKWFYAAVKRAFEPGCKFDNMLILHDNTQGTGKTNTIELLCSALGLNKYCSNVSTLDPRNKDTYVTINSSWIVLWDELGYAIKFESNTMKNLLTKTFDNYRDPYERTNKDHLRKCVFIGTTNDDTFLKDYTDDNERRYWILSCHGVAGDSRYWKEWNEKYDAAYITQVWAEAVDLYKNEPDFNYRVLDAVEKEWLTSIQKSHRTVEVDPYRGIILETLDKIAMPQNKWKTFKGEAEFKEAFEAAYKGENIVAPGDKTQPVKKISESHLNYALVSVMHFDKGLKYLKALLSDRWTRKQSYYNGVQCYIYVKNDTKNLDN